MEEKKSWLKIEITGKDAGGTNLKSEENIESFEERVAIFIAFLDIINCDAENSEAWEAAKTIRTRMIADGLPGALVEE